MKKKETLFFIHIIVFLLSSLIVNAKTHTNVKNKEYPTLLKEKIERPLKLYPERIIASLSLKKQLPTITKIKSSSPQLILNSILLGILTFCVIYNLILFITKNEKLYLYCCILSTFSLIWSFIEFDTIWYFLKSSTGLWKTIAKIEFTSAIILNVANLFLIKELFEESKILEKCTKPILYFSILISLIFFTIPASYFSKNIPTIFLQVHFLIVYSFILMATIQSYKNDKLAKFLTFFFFIVLFISSTYIIFNYYLLGSSLSNEYSLMFIIVIFQNIILILKGAYKEQLYLKQRNQLRDVLPSLKNTLESEMKDLNSLLGEINEVILSVDMKGIIKKETNLKLSKKIFGVSSKNQSIFDTVFSDFRNNHNLLNKIKNALVSTGEIELKKWDILKKEFPEKITFSKNKKEKILSVKYGELYDEKTLKIKEVLLIIQDITVLEKIIENEMRVSRRNIIISELVPEKGRNLEKHKINLSNFFRESRSLISESSKLASSKNVDNINEWDEQFIWENVHTVKDNGKFIGLSGISSKLHEEEAKFLKLRPKKGKLSDELILEICSSLLAIIEVISDYEMTAEEIFGLNKNIKGIKETSYIEIEKLDKMDKKIKLLSKKVDNNEMSEVIKEWGDLFKSSLIELLKGFESLVDLTSKELNKNISYRVGGDDIYLKESILSKISDSVIHLLRNSIDHAIETPKERKNTGKNVKGSIEVKCLMLESSFQLSIKDDGVGIDKDFIGEKAIANKIITKEEYEKMLESEKVELIFKEGFSSKDEASKVSGRGLGMEIIKKNIESLGGQIKINTKKGHGTEFLLTFPFENESPG